MLPGDGWDQLAQGVGEQEPGNAGAGCRNTGEPLVPVPTTPHGERNPRL